jgi:glycosyltransferase involved in cell wall biosynthesis
MPQDIWCAIPVYNNAATIGDLVQRCRRQMANVIVVDDGSTDADLRDLLKDSGIVVLRHEHNLGKGAALLTAIRYVAQRQGRYLITLDGDGQHFPEDIPQFIAALAPNTVLLGDRQHVSGNMPRSSRFGRAFSDFWIRLETGAAIRDTQSGFRAYPVGPISQMRFCSRHYNFEVEVLTRSIWAGLRVKNVPIRVWYPDASQKISSFRPFRDNLRISLLHARLIGRRLLRIPHRQLLPPAVPSAAKGDIADS